MRQILLVIVGWLAAAGSGWAQGAYPAEMVVTAPEVEVRSGPTTKFYPTSKLRQGERVFVLREVKDQAGWLAIKPPPGSFSWINGKFLQKPKDGDPRLAFVEADANSPVKLLPGSSLVNQEPTVESATLTSGCIVVIVDRPLTMDGQTWYPIQPHPSEIRYLPADAVKPLATAAAPQGNWTRSPAGFATNPLVSEAETALQAGKTDRARELLQRAYNEASDMNQKIFISNRLQSLTPGGTQAGRVDAQSVSMSPSNPAPSKAGPMSIAPPHWSSYGILRRTELQSEGMPVYALENNYGQLLVYVTTPPGKNLRDYIGRSVAVYGPTYYRADGGVRAEVLIATHVALP